MTMSDPIKKHTITFNFPIPSPSHAAIIKRTLEVDGERTPREVKTTIVNKGDSLEISIATSTLRLLRMNVNSMFEKLDLILRTVDAFESPDFMA